MKKFLLGATAAFAIAAPGIASAQTGYVDLSYQDSQAEIGGLEGDSDGWALGGATAWGGNGTLGVQLDGVISSAEGDGGAEADAWTAGAHLFTRNDSHLVGGFVNFGNVDADGVGDFDFWTVGVEGQYYMARTTLDGAISYSEGEDLDAELLAADLGLTHFVTDNFSFGGGLGFGQIEGAGGDDDVVSYGLGAEYLFASVPVSIFGGWQHAEIDDLDSDSDTLGVGVRYNWGGSLLDRNRNGASLARGGGLGRFGGLL
jgi:hypothetical protein